jgi:hypothetical protein
VNQRGSNPRHRSESSVIRFAPTRPRFVLHQKRRRGPESNRLSTLTRGRFAMRRSPSGASWDPVLTPRPRRFPWSPQPEPRAGARRFSDGSGWPPGPCHSASMRVPLPPRGNTTAVPFSVVAGRRGPVISPTRRPGPRTPAAAIADPPGPHPMTATHTTRA